MMHRESPSSRRVAPDQDKCLHRFSYAFKKVRGWHVGPVQAGWLALRYGLTGDTGRFRSHAGWRVSRLRRGHADEDE